MTAIERIQEFLRERKGRAFCDDCLSKTLSIKPRQQVEQKTKVLEKTPGFDRRIQHCQSCGETHKLAVSAVQI